MTVRPFLVNGEWRTGEGTFEVHSPYDDAVVAEIGVPTAEDVEEAVATAAETFEGSRSLPVHARADALDHISRRLGESIDQNAELIAQEEGSRSSGRRSRRRGRSRRSAGPARSFAAGTTS